MRGTIVARGGGGFSMSEDGASAIDDYILDLTGKTSPKVCFVPTASGDAPDYGKRFEAAFQGRARTSLLSLFGGGAYDYTDPHVLLDRDVVYVGGGSTANLLALWRLHGVPDLLAQAAENGTVLAGISAGANCWFEACSTDSFSPLAPLADGLGFAKGSICPHYLGDEHRRATYQRWVASGELPPGYAVDDYAAVVLRDGALVDVISERSGTVAYRVDADCEHPLEVRRL